MAEIMCLDINGNTILNFTQWDSNQKIVIDGEFTELELAPYVDFWNENQANALRMTGVVNELGQIEVEIPNALFLDALPMIIFVYLRENIDGSTISGGKTVLTSRIPVRPKPKPHDFSFEDNVHVVSLLDLEEKLNELNDSLTAAEASRVEAENIRIENENERIEAENLRQSNENTRQTNESQRINNENERVTEHEAIMQEAQSAIKDAQDATSAANQAADIANESSGAYQTLLQLLSEEVTQPDVDALF